MPYLSPINSRQVQFISSQIQFLFTCKEFVDNNDIHFLDIKINSLGATIYRKSTHTGQYSHYSSFTPRSRKSENTMAVRAFVQRAQKYCSTHNLLNNGIQKINDLTSWNGFPRWSRQSKYSPLNPMNPEEPNKVKTYQQFGLNCPSLERKVIVSCELQDLQTNK